MTFNIKRHDTRVPYVAALKSDGAPINLSSAEFVKLKLRAVGASDVAPKVNGTCTIQDAVNGVVNYVWAAADLDTVGEYSLEFEITWADGGIQTVPNDGYNDVVVQEDLDAG